jgi:hypothetical protein
VSVLEAGIGVVGWLVGWLVVKSKKEKRKKKSGKVFLGRATGRTDKTRIPKVIKKKSSCFLAKRVSLPVNVTWHSGDLGQALDEIIIIESHNIQYFRTQTTKLCYNQNKRTKNNDDNESNDDDQKRKKRNALLPWQLAWLFYRGFPNEIQCLFFWSL